MKPHPSRPGLGLLVLLLIAIAVSAAIIKTRLHPANALDDLQPGTEVGQIIEGAGRANYDWFKRPGVKFGVAFKVQKGGNITQVAIPWRYTIKDNDQKKSYGWGNFGSYAVELQSNGKDNYPSGLVLANVIGIQPAVLMQDKQGKLQDDYPLLIPLNARLTAGNLYHLVIRNVDVDPATNWSSANTVMTRITPWDEWAKSGTDARAETWADGKWTPWSSKYDPWNKDGRNDLNGSHMALVLTWADNSQTGDPYWSSAVGDPALFWGSYRAGELIAWNHATISVTTIGLSVGINGKPAGPLLYHLEEIDGDLAMAGTLATAEQIAPGEAQTWVYANLPQPYPLAKGHRYRLWFHAPQCTDAKNGYFQYPVYGPGDDGSHWIDRTWGGRKSHYITGTDERWNDVETHDLTFSLQTGL